VSELGAYDCTGLLLPERARLFHIGIPKTGTSVLQHLASASRERLLQYGVNYPPGTGSPYNHRDAVMALSRHSFSNEMEAPDLSCWKDFAKAVRADEDNRVWISHESACESAAEDVRTFCDDLGERLHVVITLRHYGSLLPSAWAEQVKWWLTMPFDVWLRHLLVEEPGRRRLHPGVHTRFNQGLVVRRWAEAVGAENVTVVVTDKHTPDLIFQAFSGLLGLPADFFSFSTTDAPGRGANKRFSFEEVELSRQITLRVKDELDRDEFKYFIRFGAVERMIEGSHDGFTPTRVVLPEWAADIATERGGQYADEIAGSGVRVVGDLDILRKPAKAQAGHVEELAQVPMELAATAAAGAVLQGLGPYRRLERLTARSFQESLASVSTAELLSAAVRRVLTTPSRMLARGREPKE
jgi:hypothetical protein